MSNTKTADTPVALTPDELLQAVRSLRERVLIPQLEGISRNSRLQSVNPAFIAYAISAAAEHEIVQKAIGSDSQLAAEVLEANRWMEVISEVNKLLAVLTTANRIRRQWIGLKAGQAFHICKQLSRDGDPGLKKQVAEMRRQSPYVRKRNKAGDAPQSTPPVVVPKV